MSTLRLQLDRLDIRLHGVSAAVAERAVAGLAEALQSRLQGVTPGAAPMIDLGGLELAPLQLDAGVDADGLRALLAERIGSALQRSVEGGGGGPTEPSTGGRI
jgi:hypothetical protein